MGKGSSKSSDAVERLLDERRKTGEFLVRLGDARDDSPEHVRNRVRQGYEKRMDEVTEELKGRRADLEKSLLAKAEIRSEIAAKARHVKERLEEAQVRRTVGEIDDAQWAKAQSPKAKSPKGAAKDISDSSKSTAGKPDPGASGRQPVGAYLKRAEERKSGKFTPSRLGPQPSSRPRPPTARTGRRRPPHTQAEARRPQRPQRRRRTLANRQARGRRLTSLPF
jgi:hypothetical protein